MRSLDNECSTGIQQIREPGDHRVDSFASNEREVRHCDVDFDMEISRRHILVRSYAKISTAKRCCLLDELRDGINANTPDASLSKRSNEPAFSASDVENSARTSAHHCVDDRFV